MAETVDQLPPPGPFPDPEAIQHYPNRTISITPVNQANIGSVGTVDALPVTQKALPPPMTGKDADAYATNSRLGDVMNAFGQGYADQWGAPNFAGDLAKAMKDYDLKGDVDVGKAFNEAFVRPALNALDLGIRGISGTGQAIHDASVAAGGPATAVAAGMEAFPAFGMELGRVGWFPGKLEKPVVTGAAGSATDLRVAKDLGVIGKEAEPLADGPPAEVADKALPAITAYHGSPYSFDAFSLDKIGTGEGAQSYGHGLYFAEAPEVAQEYQSKLGLARLNLHDAPTIDRLTKAGKSDEEIVKALADRGNPYGEQELSAYKNQSKGAIYRVHIHANKEDFLDLDKALDEQTPQVQAALKQAMGIDYYGKFDQEKSDRLWDEFKAAKGQTAVRQGFIAADDKLVADRLREAGIPGSKYLDQGSRSQISVEHTLAEGGPWKAGNRLFANKADADVYAKEANAQATHNFVIFNDKDVEITHRNGEQVSNPVPATVNPNNVTQPGQYPWFENAQAYLSKLDAPDGVVNLLQDALAKSDFTQARSGNVPVAQWQALADASGIPSKLFKDAKGPASDLMKHDDAVRASTAMMLKAADDVTAAAKALKLKGGVEDGAELAALGEAVMRRKMIVDTALEQVMGLRAEFGRTGNALQEFLKVKGTTESLNDLLKDKSGMGADGLRNLADGLDKLPTRTQKARFMREAGKPDFMDKLLWYWTNSLLSGPITHAKYALANTAYVAHDALIATPAAGISGGMRQLLSDEQIDRVYMGEAVAKVYGLIAGIPDALVAAKQAVRTGLPTALPAQLKGAGRTNPVTGLKPIEGPLGTAIGAPSNVIAGIHSFYNFLGYRAEIEARGYRQAVKDGYRPTSLEFWKAQRDHANYPDDPTMDAGILAGQRANFVQDLGPFGQAAQSFLYKTKVGRFVIPFLKVPGNIQNFIQEGTPLAFADARMRKALLGTGAEKDMAIGRLAGGSAIMGWAAYKALGDEITGSGPTDPKERAEWMRTHVPSSIKIGGQWVSVDRFGPVGGWLSAAANLTAAAQSFHAWYDANPGSTEKQKKEIDANLQEAYSRIVAGAAAQMKEGGFQGLFDLVDAFNDPNRSRSSNFGRTAATFLPYSSLQSQTASFFDPYLRETNTFVDGIKNAIPGARQSIPAAVDWLGDRRPNPGYHSIVKSAPQGFDPIDLEMQHLDLKPTVPPNNLRGATMTPDQYDEYKVYAGVNTRHLLEHFMQQPSWPGFPDYAKKQTIEHLIGAARKQAEATMFAKYPNLINESVQDKTDTIMGNRTAPAAYQRP